MRVKRYVAPSVRDAMSQVKRELGEDALILQTRPLRRAGLLGLFGPRRVEVVAAVEADPKPAAARSGDLPAGFSRALTEATRRLEALEGLEDPDAQPAASPWAQRPRPRSGAEPAPALQPAKALRPQSGPEPAAGAGAAGRRAHAAATGPRSAALKATGVVSWLPTPIGEGAPGQPALAPAGHPWPPEAATLYRHLVQRDFEPTLARALVEESLRQARSGGGSAEPGLRELWEGLRLALARSIPVQTPWERQEKGRVAVLIGPTGVGKTTTVAKLAANYALVGGWRVGLVTTDTYRVAAVEHLQAYADLIGLPLRVAVGAAEIRETVRSLEGLDLVLIDTAGRSFRAADQLAEVQAVVDAVPEAERHLVVAATTRRPDARALMEAYQPFRYDALIVTKLDETSDLACLANLAHYAGKPVSYLTTGQQVPEDIEVADPARIAEQVLGRVPPW